MSAARLLEAQRAFSMDARMLVQEEENEAEGVTATTRGATGRWLNLARFIAERLVFLVNELDRSVRFLFSPANTGESITRDARFREADIVHLHWITGAFLSLRALKGILKSGKPVVWTFHDMWAFTGGCHYALDCERYREQCGRCLYMKRPGNRDLSHRVWKRKQKLFSQYHATVVAPSRWMADCARASSLLGHWDTRVIPYSVDTEVFQPVDRLEACRNLGLDPEKRYILFGAASVQSMLKGFAYFQDAMRIFHREHAGEEGVEIIIFGKTRGDEDRLFPLPTRNIAYIRSARTLSELYSASTLFVIPSVQDNLPNTVIESMLCGTPVVGFRTGGIPEIIDHLENGYVAEYKSAADLAKGIRWILDVGNYGELSEGARHSAAKKYSPKDAAEAHTKLYEELLQKRGKQ